MPESIMAIIYVGAAIGAAALGALYAAHKLGFLKVNGSSSKVDQMATDIAEIRKTISEIKEVQSQIANTMKTQVALMHQKEQIEMEQRILDGIHKASTTTPQSDEST